MWLLTWFFCSGFALFLRNSFTIDLHPILVAMWSAESPTSSGALTHSVEQRLEFKIGLTKSIMPEEQA